MKPRKVTLTLEVTTDIPLNKLRAIKRVQISTEAKVDQGWIMNAKLDVVQCQANVIEPAAKPQESDNE